MWVCTSMTVIFSSLALATLRHRDGRLASHQERQGGNAWRGSPEEQCFGAAAASLVARSAPAQTWPSGPIRIVVPFPPGGSTDALARLVQTGLQQRLGANIIIENKPGASGAAGTAIVREVAAGRQHLADRVRYALGQSLPDEPAVRHREGPRSRDAGRDRAVSARGQHQARLQDRSPMCSRPPRQSRTACPTRRSAPARSGTCSWCCCRRRPA